MTEGPSRDDFTVSDIAPYVLEVLEARKFFALLDEDFWPSHLTSPLACDHTLRRTGRILQSLGMDSEDQDEVILVVMSRGACCDCEILYNVAEESRLKARYWKSRFSGLFDR
jgi:Protein of unknown function (DUF2695)